MPIKFNITRVPANTGNVMVAKDLFHRRTVPSAMITAHSTMIQVAGCIPLGMG